MATTFTGLRVQDTYNAILKIGDNSNLSGTAKILSDGVGNNSSIYLSTTRFGIGITPAYQFHTSGNAKIGGNLIISGNLTVNGTLTYLNVTDLQVEDPLIKLAKDNTSNTLDIGFFGKYVESATTKYTGLFWDASTDKFRLYEGLQVEPTTTVDVTGTGYTRSLLNANLEGNVTGTVSSLSNHDTNDLVEGSVNLYYTNARADARVNLQTGVNLDLSNKDTDDLSEGSTNLYFTTARARASFSAGDGITITNGVIASEGDAEVAKRIDVTVKNVSGGELAKGVVVHAAPTATPPSGNVIEVIAADANDAAKMPAIGVLNETIADEAEGEAVMFGAVSGIDTSSFSIGDELYVSETAGEFTATKPTAFSSQVQKIAVVIKSHASNGLIKVFGAGRANDVPNRVDRDMNFTDDSELSFGDSSDLKIYHSTNNIVRINTGDLIFNSFVVDGDIKFQLDNGIGTPTEYMRLDGGEQKVIFSRSPWLTDNLRLYFGNDTANDGNIYWDSTASQLFISGESKFLNDLYVVETITSTKDGIALQMDGGSSAEGIRLQADSSTTYAVFLRSINPASGETSPWLYQENSPEWGIWHNNPINSFDFTRNGSISGAIETNVGGETNSVMIRLNNTNGSGTFVGNISTPEIDLPSGGMIDWANGDARIVEGLVNNYSLSFQTYDGTNVTTALRLDGNNTATFANNVFINSLANATTDTDKFLVSDSGEIKYRTGAEIISDLSLDGNYVKYNGTTQSTTSNVTIKLQNTVTTGYNEMQLINDSNDQIVVGSIGTAYSSSSWANSAYVYATGTGRNLYLKSQDGNVSIFAGGTALSDVKIQVNASNTQFNNDIYVNDYKSLIFERGSNDYSNIITTTNYPSQGYTTAAGNYWLKAQSKGGFHIVLNTDGSDTSAENSFDDFVIFQGVHDGTPRFRVSNVGNTTIAGTVETTQITATNGLNYLKRNTDASLQLRSENTRSGLFITKPATDTVMGSALVLADESYRLGTASYYHMVMLQNGNSYFNQNLGIGKDPDAPLVVYKTGDVWHTVIGNDTGQLRIGGQNGNGAVIQSRNQAGTVRDLYIQRDGGDVIVSGTAVGQAGSFSITNNGFFRNVLASGSADSTLINGIYGVSNGFQLINDASNNQSYLFHNGGSVSLKIDTNGRVGIGNPSPDNQLTVKAANCIIDAQSTADGQTIGFRAGYLNNADLCGFFRYTTGDAQLYIDNNFTGNNGVYSDINFRNKANGGTSLINRMKIKGSSGYVGIATENPLHNLQIGTAATNGSYSMMIEGNFANNAKSSNPRLNLIDTNFGITAGKYGSGGTDDALGIFAYQGTGRGIVFAHTTAGNTTSLSGMRQDMFIDGGTGRVGINTVDPSTQLDVYQGNIRRSGINSGSYLEIGDLPGYAANEFASLTSGGTIHFSNNGKYCAYLEGGNTYFGILNSSSQTRVFLNTSGNSYLTGGNFGVGVSTPDTPLAVYQSGDVWHAKIGNDSGQIRFGGQTGSGAVIQSRTNTGTERDLYIQRDGGNVGINVNSAKTKLHIGPLSGGNATAQERLRLSGDYAGTGSGALLRFTNQHNSGSNPNSGEYNLGGIIAYDFRSDWGGALALQTAPPTSAGGTLVNRLVINPEGRVGIANSNPGYTLDVTGTIRATSDVIAFSDKRVKENINTVTNALEKVTKLRGVTYTRKDINDKSTKVGVIAQEVLDVLPEVVSQDEEGNYSVAYGNMAGVFIEAIKELKAEVDSLKQEIKQLKK